MLTNTNTFARTHTTHTTHTRRRLQMLLQTPCYKLIRSPWSTHRIPLHANLGFTTWSATFSSSCTGEFIFCHAFGVHISTIGVVGQGAKNISHTLLRTPYMDPVPSVTRCPCLSFVCMLAVQLCVLISIFWKNEWFAFLTRCYLESGGSSQKGFDRWMKQRRELGHLFSHLASEIWYAYLVL
jgi:hypothetical protein